MWLKPFEKGAVEYGEEGLAELEAIRAGVGHGHIHRSGRHI